MCIKVRNKSIVEAALHGDTAINTANSEQSGMRNKNSSDADQRSYEDASRVPCWQRERGIDMNFRDSYGIILLLLWIS